MDYVRRHDYENYLSNLLLPSGSRDAMFAVRAFNTEVAQIQDVTTDSRIGLMRIHFWKESLEKIYQGVPPHSPIAFELAKAVSKCNLTRRWLNRIIEGREEQILSDNSFPSVLAVEQRSEKTHSSVLLLAVESLGVANVHADHAASHIGKAHGFVTLVRAVPFHSSRNRVYLPTELMIKHHVSQEDVLRRCTEQKMKDLIFDLASEAHKHLQTASSFKKDIPKQAMVAFLPTVSINAYLKAIQRVDFNVFDSQLHQRNNWLPFSLWRQKQKGTF